jgi:hypothetical protein
MADPHWTSYVGMVTGIIGAFTGIIGYLKASLLKSLDLRLELKKATHNAITDLRQIEELINKADKSRKAVAAARGMFRSGMMQKWTADVKKDKIQLMTLLDNAPNSEENIEKCSQRVLESKLIEIHKFQAAVKELKEKYVSEYNKDDEERKQIREDHRMNRQQRFNT